MPGFRKTISVAALAAALAAGTAQAQSYLMAGNAPVRTGFGAQWRAGPASMEAEREAGAREAVVASYTAEVQFAFDDDTLTGEARKQLDALAQKLAAIEVDRVVAVGHSDAVGSPQYNRRLSARRAKAVGDYLAGKGVAAERLQLVALGARDPAERRVEVELVGRKKN